MENNIVVHSGLQRDPQEEAISKPTQMPNSIFLPNVRGALLH